MRKCVYCLTEFDEKENSKEHILQNSLGSSLSSKSIVCSNCNQKYGHECDVEIGRLADIFKFATNTKTDRNSSIKPLVNLRDDNGAKYSLTPEGKPILMRPYVIEVEPDKIKLVYPPSPAFEKWAQKHLEVYLNDNGYDANTIECGPKEEVESKVDRLNGQYIFNFNKIAQGILKSAFNLIAYYNYNAALDDSFEKLRTILMKDNLNYNILENFVRFPNFLPLPDDNFALFAHQFHIYSKGKNVEASVRLFGSISFCLRLSDNYNGEDINLTYRIDPTRKANSTDTLYIPNAVKSEEMFNFDTSFLFDIKKYHLKSFNSYLLWYKLKVKYGNLVSLLPDILRTIKQHVIEIEYIVLCENILKHLCDILDLRKTTM